MKSIRTFLVTTLIFSTFLFFVQKPLLFASESNPIGSVLNPYIIYTVDDLKKIKTNLAASYKLANDIDLQNQNWDPIGTFATPFKGSFDGNGYTIRNLKIETSLDTVGLFGQAEKAEIKNCTLENVNINAQIIVGGLVGNMNRGTIANCSIKGTGAIKGTVIVGGLVGQSVSAKIDRCAVVLEVVGKEDTGGLVGELLEYSGQSNMITNSYVQGNISCANDYAGGIIGRVSANLVTISSCYFVGELTSGPGWIGGIIGTGTANINIVSCYYDESVLKKSGYKTDEGRTTAQMKDKNNYKYWIFGLIWEIKDGNYPVLSSSYIEPTEPSQALEGNGTKEAPYIIKTRSHLEGIRNNLSAYYELGNDINLNYEAWQPIGKYGVGNWFTGSFDGKGFAIKNVNILRPNDAGGGIFGYAQNAVFNDLKIQNISVVAGGYTGSLVGYLEKGKISKIFVTEGSIVAGDSTGGLIGYASDATFEQSFSEVDVQGGKHVGGLVGIISSNILSKFTNCYANNELAGIDNVGGLVGSSIGILFDVENCYSVGSIVSTYTTKGGIIGNRGSGIVSIRNSYFEDNTNQFKDPNGRTKAFLQKKATFENWDFENIWSIEEDQYYPKLVRKNNIVIDENEISITYQYDKNGRLIEALYSSGKKITYDYDENGNLLKEIITTVN